MFMENLLKQAFKGVILSSVVWATACSQINFAPSADQSSFNVPDTDQKETFNFDDDGTRNKVDILFVNDDSASMINKQNKLGAALNPFITNLKNVDWQLGITTTDITDGPFGQKGNLIPMKGTSLNILNKDVPNYAAVFANTIHADVLETCNEADIPCPSSDERPLMAAVMAMQKRYTQNAGFFRDGADLAIVILSDEDEGSDGTNAIAAIAVMQAFNAVFGNGRTLTAYGIIVRPGDTACYTEQAPTSGHYGNYISQFVALTGGVTGSICDADYSSTLAAIGQRVHDAVKSLTLKYLPDASTVQVNILPEDPSLTWTLIGSQIVFNKAPAKGTRVDVIYLPKQP
jgi:hypothetical protein